MAGLEDNYLAAEREFLEGGGVGRQDREKRRRGAWVQADGILAVVLEDCCQGQTQVAGATLEKVSGAEK